MLLLLILFAALDPIYGIVLVALIGPIGAYLLAARKMSGKIVTSEAAQLWEESRAIREWSATRITACDSECSELRKALSEATQRIGELEEKLEEAREMLVKLERKGL